MQRLGDGGLLLLHLYDQRYQQHDHDSTILGIGDSVYVPIAGQPYIALEINVLVSDRGSDRVGDAVQVLHGSVGVVAVNDPCCDPFHAQDASHCGTVANDRNCVLDLSAPFSVDG